MQEFLGKWSGGIHEILKSTLLKLFYLNGDINNPGKYVLWQFYRQWKLDIELVIPVKVVYF